ncbi:alpha-hydroxy-acid oxidizing protein [Kribbella turkmenica]|uniref:alpha-hydroxy-acid oxidizing protein n=1 Tax=Kribbella turkmenica TaxID=2530375 RepID=UPI0038991BB3
MLPSLQGFVGADVPVHLNGGIKRCSDVNKTIAVGADAVFVGRLHVYGLMVDGRECLRILSPTPAASSRSRGSPQCSNSMRAPWFRHGTDRSPDARRHQGSRPPVGRSTGLHAIGRRSAGDDYEPLAKAVSTSSMAICGWRPRWIPARRPHRTSAAAIRLCPHAK